MPEGLRSWLRSHQKQGYALLLARERRHPPGNRRSSQIPRRPIGVIERLAHLGAATAVSSPRALCRAGRWIAPDALRWCRPPSPDFFLPQQRLAARFRNRLKTALLHLPEVTAIPASVWRQKWVVDVQPAGSGQTAIKYLAAYVQHTALGSQRILSADDGHVSFQYKDSPTSNGAPCAWAPLSSCAASCNTSCPKASSASATSAGWRRRPRSDGNASSPCWTTPRRPRWPLFPRLRPAPAVKNQ